MQIQQKVYRQKSAIKINTIKYLVKRAKTEHKLA